MSITAIKSHELWQESSPDWLIFLGSRLVLTLMGQGFWLKEVGLGATAWNARLCCVDTQVSEEGALWSA